MKLAHTSTCYFSVHFAHHFGSICYENHIPVNGISSSTHTTICTHHTTHEQNSGIDSIPLPNDKTSFQHFASQTSAALPRSNPVSTREECIVVIKVELDKKCKETLASLCPICQKLVIEINCQLATRSVSCFIVQVKHFIVSKMLIS
jgi:hypothetical protein